MTETSSSVPPKRLLGVLFLGTLLAALDIAVVGPALPALREAFGLSERAVAWTFTAFVLANLTGLPVMAALADRVGRKRVYLFDIGLFAVGTGTTVLAKETIIARTQPLVHGKYGYGILAPDGVSITLERVAITDNHYIGLFTFGTGTTVLAKEVLFARTQPLPDGQWGWGISVQSSALLSLERAAITDNYDIGLFASELGTTVNAADVIIARTRQDTPGSAGRGINAQSSAQLTFERTAVTDNHDIGLFAAAGATVTATEMMIARTQPVDDGSGGRGAYVQNGAQLTLEGAAILDSHEAGVMFLAADGSVTNSLLANTSSSPANILGLADGLLATAADSSLGFVLTVSGVIARGNARAGVFFDNAGGAIKGCVSTDNGIGLVVQGEARPDVEQSNVIESNNENLLSDGDLAVPDTPIELPDLPELD
mgnify:CR=1 FL=1